METQMDKILEDLENAVNSHAVTIRIPQAAYEALQEAAEWDEYRSVTGYVRAIVVCAAARAIETNQAAGNLVKTERKQDLTGSELKAQIQEMIKAELRQIETFASRWHGH
jgi:uncharacterized protein (DUF1778 family)